MAARKKKAAKKPAKKKAARRAPRPPGQLAAGRGTDTRAIADQGGRPTTFTRPRAEQIFYLLGQGVSLRRMCRDLEELPHAQTIRRWMLGQGIPDDDLGWFRENYKEARVLFEDHVFEKLGDTDRDVAPLPAHVARGKLWSDNVKWSLARMNRAKYGDRTELGIGGTPDAEPVKVAHADMSNLTADERKMLRKLAQKAITKKGKK